MKRKEEMYAHIEQCAAKSQTQCIYCQEQGLNLATFYYWKKRYQEDQSQRSEFVTITSSGADNRSTGKIEILFLDGSRLNCGYDIPANLFRTLIGH